MQDLRDQMTVFVITAGSNPSYPLCREAIERQSTSFRLDIIRDYHPLSVAFQEMLTRCRTPYYIEVDEDMVLRPDAVETMYRAIRQAPDDVAMVCFQLQDVHPDVTIYGVKVYKHAILQDFPYNLQHGSCEVEQLDRLHAAGYRYELVEEVMGDHAPRWSPPLIFERYLNLMEKFKDYGYSWLESLPARLWQRLRENPSEENLYALLGAFTSILSEKRLLLGEKDFTHRRREYNLIRSCLEAPHSAILYMTARCNFKCRYCYRQHHGLEDFPDLSPGMAAQLLQRFPAIRSACVCGLGEPLLASTLIPVLELLKRQGIFASLVTNGSLLAERLPEMEVCRPDQISVSVYGSRSDVQAGYTQTEAFEATLAGVQASVHSGIPTYLSYVCSKETWDDVPAFLRLATSLDVAGVHLHNLLPHFSEPQNDSKFWDLVLTKDDQPLLDELRRLPEAQIVKRYPVLISRGQTRRACDSPWTTIGIDGNGSITVCNSVAPPCRANGTLSDPVLWQNAYCTSFRQHLAEDRTAACRQCFRNWDG